MCVVDNMIVSSSIVIFGCRRPKVLMLRDCFRIDLLVCAGQEKIGLCRWAMTSFVKGYFCFQLAQTTVPSQCQAKKDVLFKLVIPLSDQYLAQPVVHSTSQILFGTLVAGEAPSAPDLLLTAPVASVNSLAEMRCFDMTLDIRIRCSLSCRVLTALFVHVSYCRRKCVRKHRQGIRPFLSTCAISLGRSYHLPRLYLR